MLGGTSIILSGRTRDDDDERPGAGLQPGRGRPDKRRYAEDVLSRIAMIDLLRDAGFSLEEVCRLLSAPDADEPPGPEWQALMVRKQAELDELLAVVSDVRRLVAHLADCQCSSFAQCVARVRRSEAD